MNETLKFFDNIKKKLRNLEIINIILCIQLKKKKIIDFFR